VTGANWRKSSYSFSNGNCVEVGAWRKPSSSAGNGACLEACSGPGLIRVRDTKLAGRSPILAFGSEAWERFTSAVKRDAGTAYLQA